MSSAMTLDASAPITGRNVKRIRTGASVATDGSRRYGRAWFICPFCKREAQVFLDTNGPGHVIEHKMPVPPPQPMAFTKSKRDQVMTVTIMVYCPMSNKEVDTLADPG